MTKKSLSIQQFHGGQSSDIKLGQSHSHYYSKHLDFRKSPTAMTILPETVLESSTTVTGLITELIQLPSGKLVGIDSSGGVYTRTTGGTWAKNGTTLSDTACGMVYNLQKDTIYIPGLTSMHTITDADGLFSGGSFTVNEDAFSSVFDQSGGDTGNTYTTTNAINEGATHVLYINPELEPLYSIKLWVTTKGSDDLTVTLHDSANNTLGTSTVTNANLTNGAYNEFVFSSPIRTTSGAGGATYHVHITHASASSTTINTGTSSDFSDASYLTFANRFVNPNNGIHHATEFLQYICITNERYLAVWEPISTNPLSSEFLQHRLTFPQNYEGTSSAIWTEYLAIACEKRSTSATNEYQTGRIFFWDGTSKTYNFSIDVPEGAPYAVHTHRNVLYYFAGGSWWAYNGGNPVKIIQLPNTDTEFTDTSQYLVNLPNTMAVRNGILLGAFPSETSSTTIEHAVYSYGARDRGFNDSFGLSYTDSTGNTTNAEATKRIGGVWSFGDKLFVSWRDDSSYGVDIVDPNSDPFSTAEWQSLILDDGRPDKTKEAVKLIITFETLPSGATVTPKYKIDRAGSFTTGTAATAGDTSVTLNINKRYKEIQIGFDAVATTATPTITSITFIREVLNYERD